MTELDGKKRNFTIESILQRGAGASTQQDRFLPPGGTPYPQFLLPSLPLLREPEDHFDWISCTRYNPPRLQRDIIGNELPKKRKYLSRSPRIPFNSEQLAVLEGRFRRSPYLSGSEVQNLARDLRMSDVRVKIWFQNRRAREKREKQAKNEADCAQTESETSIVPSDESIIAETESDPASKARGRNT